MHEKNIIEINKLYERIIVQYPNIVSKKEEKGFILYDFPTSKFKLSVGYRLHFQSLQVEHFKYFKNKLLKKIEEQFPAVRFFWKTQEVFIYREEDSSGLYVSEKKLEGFSAIFFNIIEFIHNETTQLSWK